MIAHRVRTWAPCGHTLLVRVRGGSRGPRSLAALACCKDGERSRLIYRPRFHHRREGDRNSWHDYRNLLARAHLQLGGPIVVPGTI